MQRPGPRSVRHSGSVRQSHRIFRAKLSARPESSCLFRSPPGGVPAPRCVPASVPSHPLRRLSPRRNSLFAGRYPHGHRRPNGKRRGRTLCPGVKPARRGLPLSAPKRNPATTAFSSVAFVRNLPACRLHVCPIRYRPFQVSATPC